MLEDTSPEEQEEMKNLLSSDNSPYKVLREVAEKLREDYTRPPNKEGDLIEMRGDNLAVYVSDQSFAERGNNFHSGQWVIIEYVERRDEFVVTYRMDGVAGNSDNRRRFSVDEVTADKLESQAREYLPSSSLF